jgi:hypothetical protein
MSGEATALAEHGTFAADAGKLRERIAAGGSTVAEWAAKRLVLEAEWDSAIPDLRLDYESWCKSECLTPLPRKTWIAVLKLMDLETRSGAFAAVALKGSTAPSVVHKQGDTKPNPIYPWGTPEVRTAIEDNDLPF